MQKPRRVAYRTFENGRILPGESYGLAHKITDDCEVIIETNEGALISVHIHFVRFTNPLSNE